MKFAKIIGKGRHSEFRVLITCTILDMGAAKNNTVTAQHTIPENRENDRKHPSRPIYMNSTHPKLGPFPSHRVHGVSKIGW